MLLNNIKYNIFKNHNHYDSNDIKEYTHDEVYYLYVYYKEKIDKIVEDEITEINNKYKSKILLFTKNGNFNIKELVIIIYSYINDIKKLLNKFTYYHKYNDIIKISNNYINDFLLNNIFKINNENMTIIQYINNIIDNLDFKDMFSLINFLNIYKKINCNDNIFKKIGESDIFCYNYANFINYLIIKINNDNDSVYKMTLNKTYLLIEYIKNKKYFYKLTIDFLSKRLLSAKITYEKENVYQLKKYKNINYMTNEMLNMINDVEKNNYFSKNINLKILKLQNWNHLNLNEMKINIPFDINIKTEFNKKSNNNLLLKYDLGYSIVKYKGLDREYIIHLHPLFMFILMFLNDGDYTIEELIKKSNINLDLIKYILDIFIKNNIVIQDNDKYKQNKLFLNDNKKIYLYEKIDDKLLYDNTDDKNYSFEYKFRRYDDLIIDNIKENISETQLIQNIKENIDFDFNLSEFMTVILTNIKKNNISRINDKEIYYKIVL